MTTATDKQIVTMLNHKRARTSWVVYATADTEGNPYIARIARIITVYPTDGAGRLRVLVSDFGPFWKCDDVHHQYGWAGGYGYDKLGAATEGMTIGGKAMNHDGHYLRLTVRKMGFRMFGDMCA